MSTAALKRRPRKVVGSASIVLLLGLSALGVGAGPATAATAYLTLPGTFAEYVVAYHDPSNLDHLVYLPTSSRAIQFRLPDEASNLDGATVDFRAFGDGFEWIGTANVAAQVVTVPLPADFFFVSPGHGPLLGPTGPDGIPHGTNRFYGFEIVGTTALNGTSSIFVGESRLLFRANVMLVRGVDTGEIVPSIDLRREYVDSIVNNKWYSYPEVQTVRTGDTVILTGPYGFWTHSEGEPWLAVNTNLGVDIDESTFQLRVPYSVSSNGAQITLTIPDPGPTENPDFEFHPGTAPQIALVMHNGVEGGTETEDWDYVGVSVPVRTVGGVSAIGTPTTGNASATVRWVANPLDNGGSAITGYRVRAYSGTTLVKTQVAEGNAGSVVMTGLTNRTAYTFDVAAINRVGIGPASVRSAAVTPRAEFVPPTVTARTPASGAHAVSRTGNVTARFSEPVSPVTGGTFSLRQGATVVPAAVSYNATTRVATLNPTASLVADRIYTATLSGIRDAAGNPLAATSWSFTTGPAPVIVSTTPGGGATGVRRNANVTARFSESITGVSASTVVFSRVSTGVTWSAAIGFDQATRVLTINPTASLLPNTQYRVTIVGGNAGVRDLVGNPVSTRSWVFTTGSTL